MELNVVYRRPASDIPVQATVNLNVAMMQKGSPLKQRKQVIRTDQVTTAASGSNMSLLLRPEQWFGPMQGAVRNFD
jgi:hypothetical protein